MDIEGRVIVRRTATFARSVLTVGGNHCTADVTYVGVLVITEGDIADRAAARILNIELERNARMLCFISVGVYAVLVSEKPFDKTRLLIGGLGRFTGLIYISVIVGKKRCECKYDKH